MDIYHILSQSACFRMTLRSFLTLTSQNFFSFENYKKGSSAVLRIKKRPLGYAKLFMRKAIVDYVKMIIRQERICNTRKVPFSRLYTRPKNVYVDYSCVQKIYYF